MNFLSDLLSYLLSYLSTTLGKIIVLEAIIFTLIAVWWVRRSGGSTHNDSTTNEYIEVESDTDIRRPRWVSKHVSERQDNELEREKAIIQKQKEELLREKRRIAEEKARLKQQKFEESLKSEKIFIEPQGATTPPSAVPSAVIPPQEGKVEERIEVDLMPPEATETLTPFTRALRLIRKHGGYMRHSDFSNLINWKKEKISNVINTLVKERKLEVKFGGKTKTATYYCLPGVTPPNLKESDVKTVQKPEGEPEGLYDETPEISEPSGIEGEGEGEEIGDEEIEDEEAEKE